jgi:hypothetical protein
MASIALRVEWMGQYRRSRQVSIELTLSSRALRDEAVLAMATEGVSLAAECSPDIDDCSEPIGVIAETYSKSWGSLTQREKTNGKGDRQKGNRE